MNLKNIGLTGLMMGSVLISGTNLATAAPQDEVQGSADGKGGISHGYIQLTPGDENDGSTKPVIPTVPPGETENEGTLTLDNIVPLLFDAHKIEGKEQVYKSVVVDSNIQVTDKRGDEAGWNVQVSQTPFKDVSDEQKELKGAKMFLPIGILQTAGENVSLPPMMNSLEVNDKPEVIFHAKKGTGAGTWVDVFNKDEITLRVPAGNKAGEYMSIVTWSLLDAPK